MQSIADASELPTSSSRAFNCVKDGIFRPIDDLLAGVCCVKIVVVVVVRRSVTDIPIRTKSQDVEVPGRVRRCHRQTDAPWSSNQRIASTTHGYLGITVPSRHDEAFDPP